MILFIESAVTFLVYFYIIIVRKCDICVVFVYFKQKERDGLSGLKNLLNSKKTIVTAKAKYLVFNKSYLLYDISK